MSQFRAYRVHSHHGDIRGRLESIGLDDLSAGDVVVRGAYSGVNYKDALAATGKGRIMQRFPMVGGIDVAGTVESSSDPRFATGDPVVVAGSGLSEHHDGGFAERVRVPADWLIPLPKGLSLRESMAIGTAGLTAGLALYQMQRMGQHPAQGPILITGASGGVGSLAVDVLSAQGYEVHALTTKPDAEPYLRSLGASEVLFYDELVTGQRPLETARFAGAIDNAGDDTLAWLTRVTMPLGNIAAIGLAGGSDLNTTVMPFILRGVNLLGISSVLAPATLKAEIWTQLGSDLRPRHLDAIVSREVTLAQLPDVLDDYFTDPVMGRTLVRLTQETPP